MEGFSKKNKSFGIVITSVLFVLGVSLTHAQVSFDPPRNFLSGDGVLSMESNDFNNDGLRDFATSNKRTDTVSVHLNQGSGIFAVPWNEYHVGPFAPLLPGAEAKAMPIGIGDRRFQQRWLCGSCF